MTLSFRYRYCSHSPFVLGAFAIQCTYLHGRCITVGQPRSVDAQDLVSAFCEWVQPARIHGSELPPPVCLQVPRNQLVSVLVQLARLRVGQAIDYMQLTHRTISSRTRSRVRLQN